MCVVQWVKHPTLILTEDLISGSWDWVPWRAPPCAVGSLPKILSPSAPPPSHECHAHSLSQMNILKKKKKTGFWKIQVTGTIRENYFHGQRRQKQKTEWVENVKGLKVKTSSLTHCLREVSKGEEGHQLGEGSGVTRGPFFFIGWERTHVNTGRREPSAWWNQVRDGICGRITLQKVREKRPKGWVERLALERRETAQREVWLLTARWSPHVMTAALL